MCCGALYSEEWRLQVDGQTPADDDVGLGRHQGLAARRPLVALQQDAALALQGHQLVLQKLLSLLESSQGVVRLEHIVQVVLLLLQVVLLLQVQVLLQVQRQRPCLLVDERRLRQLVVLEGHALSSCHLKKIEKIFFKGYFIIINLLAKFLRFCSEIKKALIIDNN